jgi:hypothetical protein
MIIGPTIDGTIILYKDFTVQSPFIRELFEAISCNSPHASRLPFSFA